MFKVGDLSTRCFQTRRSRISADLIVMIESSNLTFSRPQNLSLPSSRKGPGGMSIRYFSRGVIWRALGSFLAGDDPVDGLEVPYGREINQYSFF